MVERLLSVPPNPYSICDVAGMLVVHEIVAPERVMLLTETPVTRGATAVGVVLGVLVSVGLGVSVTVGVVVTVDVAIDVGVPVRVGVRLGVAVRNGRRVAAWLAGAGV